MFLSSSSKTGFEVPVAWTAGEITCAPSGCTVYHVDRFPHVSFVGSKRLYEGNARLFQSNFLSDGKVHRMLHVLGIVQVVRMSKYHKRLCCLRLRGREGV